MWMVRAGRNAFLAQEFEEKGYVALVWNEIGDLTLIKSPKELPKLHEEAYGKEKIGKQRMSLGQITRFRFEMKIGDRVITYYPEFRVYLVGEISSDYQYQKNSPGDHNHIREVNWLGRVKRDSLSVATRNTIGAIMTLFLLSDSAATEINDLLEGKKTPFLTIDNDDSESEIENLKKETIEKSIEFIKDKIQKLDWDEMQELTAGILRSMGYKTRVAMGGPDRGADVIASPDGLGLEEPRIRVEVKHRNETVGAPLLRSFIGGLRANDRGLYVSTGGFTKEARYEAERSTVPVTLIDIDELADLLVRNYDNADTETKALVPLVKLYWPA